VGRDGGYEKDIATEVKLLQGPSNSLKGERQKVDGAVLREATALGFAGFCRQDGAVK